MIDKVMRTGWKAGSDFTNTRRCGTLAVAIRRMLRHVTILGEFVGGIDTTPYLCRMLLFVCPFPPPHERIYDMPSSVLKETQSHLNIWILPSTGRRCIPL